MSNLSEEEIKEYAFIVGFTLFTPKGFTMYRHFDNLEVAEMFASNVNIKDNHKIYVDLDLYNKEKEKNKELEDERKKYPIAMTDKQFKQTIDNAQKELKEELQRQINTREIEEKFMEDNFIHKDKIRERIKELRKIFPNDVMFTREFLITELKGLLEE